MRKNPERLAWAILLTAFAIFCSLAVGIPLGIRWYVINATQVHKTSLATIEGTVQVVAPGMDVAIAVTDSKDDVAEGSRIVTDATSRAFLKFFEDSTAIIYNKTQVVVLKSRSPRFDLSPKPDVLALEVTGGRIRIGVASPLNSPRQFTVRTPHAVIELERDGSYSIEVTTEESHVGVINGLARVAAMGKRVTLRRGERTTVEIGQVPSDPAPLERNLIVNGDFALPWEETWLPYDDQDDPEEPSGLREVLASGDRRAMRFLRKGGNKYRCDTGIRQIIDKDVRDYTYLELRINIMLIYQSVSGGGILSSEFPLMVRLDYRDVYGNPRHWVRGFYYENPAGHPISDKVWAKGERIRRNVWYPYESGNLMEELGDLRPSYIESITIYASGHDYESMVSQVELLAKE